MVCNKKNKKRKKKHLRAPLYLLKESKVKQKIRRNNDDHLITILIYFGGRILRKQTIQSKREKGETLIIVYLKNNCMPQTMALEWVKTMVYNHQCLHFPERWRNCKMSSQ